MSANILGIENILLLSGDHPKTGEYPTARAVYDLDTVQLIKTARLLETVLIWQESNYLEIQDFV
ncbi:hypothetical protein AGMMS49921_00430 [Endomicrobiia bacterium]|nr:hypothetical protein AGMMS49921_00430 [Endomicrobiia bacterium]